ncbi:DUF427 domain-containing protein [soil metagenome]
MSLPNRVEPGAGQESVWDYPRPPRIEPCRRRVIVRFAGREVARSSRALRVLETAGAPTIYVAIDDIVMESLRPAGGRSSWCEWKGAAEYLDLVSEERVSPRAAWRYPHPSAPFRALTGHLSFYPARTDGCYLDGEMVQPQPGGFYGGWVTAEIVGPIKGQPGTLHW